MQFVASVNVEKTDNDAPVFCRDYQGSVGHNSFHQVPKYLSKDTYTTPVNIRLHQGRPLVSVFYRLR